jgi:AraC-like DNA-binding protein
MASNQRTMHIMTVLPALMHAARCGMAPPAFIAHFGLDPATMADPDGRVPYAVVHRVWDELPALCNDPDAAFHAATAHPPPSMDSSPLTLLFSASPTVGAGFQRLIRFQRVHSGDKDSLIELHVDTDAFEITFHATRSTFRAHPATFVYGFTSMRANIARTLGRDIPVLDVMFRHPEPANREPYDAHFGVRVQFGAPIDRIRYPRHVFDWPQPGASARIALLAEAQARAIESTIQSTTWLDDVRGAITQLLPDGDATLERVAKALDLSPRTLQRKLEREGTSLRELVDDVRRSLAQTYISDGSMSLATIAFVLGFSEQSAFHRAFVRWTGQSPGDFRRDHGSLRRAGHARPA